MFEYECGRPTFRLYWSTFISKEKKDFFIQIMGNEGNYNIFKDILRGIKDLIKHLSDTMYFLQFLAFQLLSRFLYLNVFKIEISCWTFILEKTKMLSLYNYIIPSIIWFSLLILNPFSCKFIDAFMISTWYLAWNGSN